MTDRADDLCALLGSRLCHDLISPIGAISNGMELLEMTIPASVEMDLIRQSVDNVNARIRFFRVAFGMASAAQMVGRAEISNVLEGFFGPGRMEIDWQVPEDVPRGEAKAAFLAILCAESALPAMGTITVRRNGSWQVTAETNPDRSLRTDPALWTYLAGGAAPEEIAAKDVQFGLLRIWSKKTERAIGVETAQHRAVMTF